MRLPILPLLVAALILSISACSDSLVSPDDDPGLLVDRRLEQTASKMRHGHLLHSEIASKGGGNGKSDGSSTSSTSSGDAFVVGTTVDPYAVMERYSNDFGVSPRRMFKKNVSGFSISVAALNSSQRSALFAALDADPEISYYEPEARVVRGRSSALSMRADEQMMPTNIRAIGARGNSVHSATGPAYVPVDVYIIDSGVDHPDLNVVERIDFTDIEGQVLTPSKVMERYAILERYAVMERYEYTTGTASDPNGHGTHVAGTLAAIDDSDHLIGVAPGAFIHDYRVLDDNGNGDFAAVIEALEIITERKRLNPLVPVVVNLSLGANVGTSSYNALDEAVEAAVKEGVTIVVAAGNEATDVSNISPAHVSGAFTVGAAESARNQWSALSSSNVGRGIDIWAPGNNVESLFPNDLTYMNRMTGTSMAAPHVTGAIATYLLQNPTARPAHIKTFLRSITGKKLKRAPKNTTDLVIDISQL